MTATNQTQKFLGPESTWLGASLELYDVQGLHGGRRIFIYGTGQAVVQLVLPDRQEQRYEFELGRAEVRRLLQLCLEQNLVTIKPAERRGLPDEARPQLKLINGDQMYRTIRKWAGVEDARFDAIYTALLDLEARAVQQGPTYSGQFNYIYKPKQGWSGLVWQIRKRLNRLKAFQVEDLIDFGMDFLAALISQLPLIGLAIILLIMAFFWAEIDSDHLYGFWGAIWHGLFWVQNLILALFTGRHAWAPLNTGGWYTAGFITGVIVASLAIKIVLEILVALFGNRQSHPTRNIARLIDRQTIRTLLNRRD